MKTEKWVPCTEELAENPERVKAWKVNGFPSRFLCYDKGHKSPIVVRFKVDDRLVVTNFSVVECLIEVTIQERFITFYEGSMWAGNMYTSESEAKGCKAIECTHIVKLTYDGKDFKAECVWTKEST